MDKKVKKVYIQRIVVLEYEDGSFIKLPEEEFSDEHLTEKQLIYAAYHNPPKHLITADHLRFYG